MRAAVDKAVLVTVAVVARLLFMIFGILAWTAALIAPLAVVGGLLWLGWLTLNGHGWAAALLAGLVSVSVYALYRHAGRALPASASLTDRFIAWLGTIKFFTSPLSFVEDPGSYRIKGTDMRALVDGDQPLLQPGDILLRGFDGYLDGELIRRTGGASGAGRYLSHAALYLGGVDDRRDREIAARRLKVMDPDGSWRAATEAEKERFRGDPGYFQPGRQMVIHSMAKGVHLEDILTFVRCDYLVVLRLPEQVVLTGDELKNRPLVALSDAALAIDERLTRGQAVSRQEVVAAARDSALGRLGTGYDFLFDSCHDFHKFSCSELVYYSFKSVHRHIGLEPRPHSFAGLLKRTTISPADVYGACDPGRKLVRIWSNVPEGR